MEVVSEHEAFTWAAMVYPVITLFWATVHPGAKVTCPLRVIDCSVFVMPGLKVPDTFPGLHSPNRVVKLDGGGTSPNAP
jgi:hypothetical protein